MAARCSCARSAFTDEIVRVAAGCEIHGDRAGVTLVHDCDDAADCHCGADAEVEE